MSKENLLSKIYGCLCGLSIGDCMGMPTEFMTPEEISKYYGFVDRLIEPWENHIHNDMTKGMVTDDTKVTIEIINEIIRNNKIDLQVAVNALKNWAVNDDIFNKSYLGPSSAKAIKELLENADPIKAGEYGTTVGAAMRVVPAGIFNAGNIDKAIDAAEILSLPTHGTNIAVAGAACIAAAIAEALSDNSNMDSIIKAAFHGAVEGQKRGTQLIDALLSKRIELALKITEDEPSLKKSADILYKYIGCNMETNEIIPVVIAIFYKSKGNMMDAIKIAANIGGDTDTIGALVGALCGAFTGTKYMDEKIVKEIEEINKINFKEISMNFAQCTLNIKGTI